MRGRDVDAYRARATAGVDRMQHRRSRADEIIDDDDAASGDIAGEQLAADDAMAALLVHDGEIDRSSNSRLQQFGNAARARGAADVRCRHRIAVAVGILGEVPGEERRRLQMHGLAAERVVERRLVVHFERNHPVGIHRFEQPGDVARRYGIMRLGPAVLARIGEIGNAGGHAARTGILERADQEKQAAQPIVGRAEQVAEQRLHHVHGASPHAIERAELALAALEFELFVRAERDIEPRGNTRPDPRRGGRHEYRHPCFLHARHRASLAWMRPL